MSRSFEMSRTYINADYKRDDHWILHIYGMRCDLKSLTRKIRNAAKLWNRKDSYTALTFAWLCLNLLRLSRLVLAILESLLISFMSSVYICFESAFRQYFRPALKPAGLVMIWKEVLELPWTSKWESGSWKFSIKSISANGIASVILSSPTRAKKIVSSVITTRRKHQSLQNIELRLYVVDHKHETSSPVEEQSKINIVLSTFFCWEYTE